MPDLSRLSDEALRLLVKEALADIEKEPDDRFPLGRLDILRAEIVHRGGDPFAES